MESRASQMVSKDADLRQRGGGGTDVDPDFQLQLSF